MSHYHEERMAGRGIVFPKGNAGEMVIVHTPHCQEYDRLFFIKCDTDEVGCLLISRHQNKHPYIQVGLRHEENYEHLQDAADELQNELDDYRQRLTWRYRTSSLDGRKLVMGNIGYRSARGKIRHNTDSGILASLSDVLGALRPAAPCAKNAAPYEETAKTKEQTMQQQSKEMITIMQLQGGAKVVSAVYGNQNPGERPYHFKNVIGVELAEGDMVVVETRDTFEIVTVANPDVLATEVGCELSDLKHVVAKVKNDEYSHIKKAESNAVQQLALSEVTAKLTTYREQVGGDAYTAVAGILGVSPDAKGIDSSVELIEE